MKILDFPQRSPEWFAARCGRITASRVADILSGSKTKTSGLTPMKFAAEILSGVFVGNEFSNASIQHGIETEGKARAAYAALTGFKVTEVGLVIHPAMERCAASPDGVVDPNGLLECKCPNTHTHLGYLLANRAPSQYETQMLWQMACCEREWVDFVSFDDRLKDKKLHLFKVRFPRDDKRIKEMERKVAEFLVQVDDIMNEIHEKLLKGERNG